MLAELLTENGGEVSWEAREARIYAGNDMLLAYEIDAESDFDLQTPATSFRDCDDPGSLSEFAACVVECPSEELFVQWIGRLADKIDDPVWVLDGDGVLWSAKHLDPRQIRL